MNTKTEGAHRGMGAEFRIEVRAFRPCVKNTLKGFVTLRIDPPGLTVNDICVHEKNGKRWLSLPARAYQRDGTTEWLPVLEIEDREVLRQFQAAGLEAIELFLRPGDGG
jgi:hypothetical protein